MLLIDIGRILLMGICWWLLFFNACGYIPLGPVDVWFADRVCADFGLKQGERRVA
ncbi:hypothetical protein [Deefgea sp. CFH1-16]|uniref:hypothetical protein n=1 Tax=Deefgea sp. CFH1-16 TaxID=2675457 RepID=UPI0015F3A2AA|nr:hypothetical protein [Deefgea sp. CFH1-16]MBM5573773.1 hypothetical protein [Deefgea sp. CFH1-16]